MQNNQEINKLNIVTKIFKYFILGVIIALSTSYISKNNLNQNSILMIAATSSLMYALLDIPIFKDMYNFV